jgi:16S rRNA G1207 methylase RsmC
MNPPYSEGRALEHLEKAQSLLKETGRLVAILPSSMKEKMYFKGWQHEWTDVLANVFKESGTSVNVVILTL